MRTPPGRIFVLVLALAPLARAQEEPRPWIYYDGVEAGQLVGGRQEIDPTNPLHVAITSAQASASSNVVTVVDNGPSANRIDIVVVGDGYQASELGDYAADVDAVIAGFFSKRPFSDYATYFNVHRVDVVSVDSGVDNDPVQGISKNTALDMGFWCSGVERLLCVNVAKAQTEAGMAPDVDQIWAVANSSKYGGAGYQDLCTLASSNGSTVDLALHEFGHSFGNLADEYWTAGTTYTGSEPSEANATIFDFQGLLDNKRKWWRWLNVNPNVGAFEGCKYNELGVYRPTSDSLMRNLGRPFQAVNGEALIMEMYRTVQPVDAATPAGVYPRATVLSVTPVHPATFLLDVQWALDGVDLPGATGETLDVSTLALTPGAHTVSVRVGDGTTAVMRPAFQANQMTWKRAWTIGEAATASLYGCGTNPSGSLLLLSGPPVLGTNLELGVENPGGFHPAGSVALLGLALAPAPGFPCGVQLPGYGMSPGQPGELLLSSSSRLGPFLTGLYPGPGTPASFVIAVPNDPGLLDLSLFAQGVLWDPAATNGVRFGLAEAARMTLGL